MTAESPTNIFGWDLPETDRMLNEESPYLPLEDPAQNIAERLTFIAHLSFNSKTWGGESGRLDRYWDAFRERLESSANQISVAEWWSAFVTDMDCEQPHRKIIVHEKNLLAHPTQLPGTPVVDMDVLNVFRRQSHDLRDRTQMWARNRRELWRAANPDFENED